MKITALLRATEFKTIGAILFLLFRRDWLEARVARRRTDYVPIF